MEGLGTHDRHSRDGVNHVQAHLHTAVGMVGLGLRQARHTVVAIAQDLYATAVVLLGDKEDGTLVICLAAHLPLHHPRHW